MESFMSYDPWAGIVSRNGIEGDLLVSGLQKSIRRADVEIAVRIAYEMYITSPQFEDKLWRRLCAISVEDVGFGDTHAPVLIDSLNRMRKEFPYNDGDRPLFFFMAIRYLCGCKKERSTDDLKNLVAKEFEHGMTAKIPDYAIDMHTRKGREMGRDQEHFLREASKVIPHFDEADDGTYKQKLLDILKKEQDGELKKQETPFTYSQFQF